MPPTMITGITSAGPASLNAAQICATSKRAVAVVAAGALAVPDAHDDERAARMSAGTTPGHRQRAHRDAGDEGVDEERDRQRHQQRQRAGHGQQRRGEGARIAARDHRRDHQRADRRRVGDRRARDAAEHQAGHHRDHAQAAGQEAEQDARELDDALADAALRQQLAGEDEQRHGDQDEGLDAADERQEDRLERVRQALHPDDADRGDQQREHQRHAGQRDDEEDAEQGQGEHVVTPPGRSARRAARRAGSATGPRRRRPPSASADRQRHVLRRPSAMPRTVSSLLQLPSTSAQPKRTSTSSISRHRRLDGCVGPAPTRCRQLVDELGDRHVRAAPRRAGAAEERDPHHQQLAELGDPGQVLADHVQDDVDEDHRRHHRADGDHRPVDRAADQADGPAAPPAPARAAQDRSMAAACIAGRTCGSPRRRSARGPHRRRTFRGPWHRPAAPPCGTASTLGLR